MYKAAERLSKEFPNNQDFIFAVRDFIVNHAQRLPKQYKPKSILESRLTPPEKAFELGMLSCGAISNIAAAMLRHVGLKVKLIHGESIESIDHAWISVYFPKDKRWTEFDLTKNDGRIPKTHRKKLECFDWEEISEQIIKDHKTGQARKTIKDKGA